jgi:hypothetical protein
MQTVMLVYIYIIPESVGQCCERSTYRLVCSCVHQLFESLVVTAAVLVDLMPALLLLLLLLLRLCLQRDSS